MPESRHCFNCGGADLDVFYEVRGIPVHSVLLMPTREAATGYPRGDLRLGFCGTCGVVQNTAFDPAVHEYSTRYEETQGFSPTFNRFAEDLARTYIERYDLHDKRLLEIGCGKGEFLVLMCELGPNRGVGIDPGYRPERTTSEAAARIEFLQDFYSEKYAHVQADFVCCRHTLEHIQPTLEFMRTIRRSVGERRETVVAFELPDVERVLDERAFWDLYYEHCSYFSLGSLARLFRTTGFDVLELEKAFGGQYLLIDARVSNGRPAPRLSAEDDLAALAAAVAGFRAAIPGVLEQWRRRLAEWRARGLRTAIWGSGSKAVAFLTTLGVGDEVGRVTDINPYRHGMYMPGSGHEIVAPAELARYRPDVVVIMNAIYRDEIAAELARMDLRPELVPLA